MRYHLEIPSLELSNKLAAEYSVMLAPGSAFGFEGYLRIGIGQTPRIFEEGLSRTAACLKQLQRDGVMSRAVAV
jgi:aspartate/methionine/tyrosine aminotransferase